MAEPASPGWCLRFLSGAVRGRTLALNRGTNLVGSAADCQVMLPGSEVQPHHLVVQVGELAVTLQRADGTVALNGEELAGSRRSLVAGDVVTIGSIAFQLERSYQVAAQDDAMFAESILPGDEPAAAPAASSADAPRAGGRWIGAAALVLLAFGLLGLTAWDGLAAPSPAAGPDLASVQHAIGGFDEVEVIGQPGGQFLVRGYVASRAQRQALQQALQPFGRRVSVSVQPADQIVEQARRYLDVPGVSVAYAGHGRLVVNGSTEDASVRERVSRLAADLHPTVLVSDHVNYLALPAAQRDAQLRAQWAEWQKLLPARLVGITENADGTRQIELADGSRYYEGAVLRSGAELKHIDADGLVLAGGPAEPRP